MKNLVMARPLNLLIEAAFILGKTWEFTVPLGWRLDSIKGGVLAFVMAPDGLKVAVSSARYEGIEYLHASCSREDRMPDYEDLVTLKRVAFGPNRYASMILPPTSEHVNIHPRCLHLWGPLNPHEWPFPAFGAGGTI